MDLALVVDVHSDESSLALSCAQCSRYQWLEVREGPIDHSFIKGDGFCSARGSSSSQPSQPQRKLSSAHAQLCVSADVQRLQNVNLKIFSFTFLMTFTFF